MKQQGKRFLTLVLVLTMLFGLMPFTGEAVFAATGDVAISAKNFPDANFRSYVSNKFDTNKNGILSLTERNAAKEIGAANQNISSMKGIEWFPNLDDLGCGHNPLTQLDLSKNTKLRVLNCPYTEIKQFDFSKNPLLESISISHNPLTSVTVTQNPKLKTLFCGSSDITQLDISKNPALQRLDVSHTKLTKLDTSRNPALTLLICEWSQLTYLNVKACTKLEKLDCSQNKLTQLDLSKNTVLKELDCSSNRIPQFDFSKNLLLTDLNCSGNHLTNLDVSKNTALTELDCCCNDLTTIDVSKNKKLTVLDIESNAITNADLTANTLLQNFTANQHYEDKITINEPVLKFDLSTLPGNFKVSKTSNWRGGTVSGTILTIDSSKPTIVSYKYEAAPGKILNVALYIEYIPLPKKTIRIEANNAVNAVRFISVDVGSKFTLPENEFTAPAGKYFKAWSIDGVEKNPGDWIIVNDNITIKAVWKDFSSEINPLELAVFRTGWKTSYRPGETVALAARAEGGTAPYRYQFYVIRSNGSRVVLRNYAYNNAFTWKPVTPDTYRVGVNVKDATGETVSRQKTVSVVSPQVDPLNIAVFRTGWKTSYTAGETVALAARAEGGTAPYRYQFYVIRSNGSRVVLRNYAYNNAFTWIPVTPDAYTLGVNVKDATGKMISREKKVSVQPKETRALQVAVFRTGWKTSYAPGETVALAARGEGGTAPYRYQFYVIRSNGSRVILRDFAYKNTFTWMPVTPDTYRVGVTIKDSKGLIEPDERVVVVK